MNQINLIGRITKTPELRTTDNGKSVCQFSIAVNGMNERTDFINIVSWEKQAENLCKYQGKGSLIGITGTLRSETYQDKDGNNRNKTYVLANTIEYLSSKKSDEAKEQVNEFEGMSEIIVLSDDDLPF